MSENDFYVAIQGLLEAAKDQGWSVEKAEATAQSAIEEWVEETEGSANG